MTAHVLAHRYQPATLWEATSSRNNQGMVVCAAPVQVRVRWITSSMDMESLLGNRVAFDAAAVVGQRIPLGSFMWLGELEDWVGTGSNNYDTEMMQVHKYEEVPDHKNRFMFRIVGLMRAHGQTPVLG